MPFTVNVEAIRQDASLLPCTVKSLKGKLSVSVQSKILSLPKLNTFFRAIQISETVLYFY